MRSLYSAHVFSQRRHAAADSGRVKNVLFSSCLGALLSNVHHQRLPMFPGLLTGHDEKTSVLFISLFFFSFLVSEDSVNTLFIITDAQMHTTRECNDRQ